MQNAVDIFFERCTISITSYTFIAKGGFIMIKKRNDKMMGTAKVGPKGQIVIPKEMRDLFSLECGDSVVLFADKKRGIAINKMSAVQSIVDGVFKKMESGGMDESERRDAEIFTGDFEEVKDDGE